MRKLNGVDLVNRKANRGKNKSRPAQSAYHGAARFIEIIPPGIPFRTIANIDHIANISFSEKREQVQVPTEGADPIPAQYDDDGVLTAPERPATHMEEQVVGHSVTIGIGAQNSEFTFRDIQVAMVFYNSLVEGLAGLCPCATLKPLELPKPPDEKSGLVDANGEDLTIEAGEEGEDLEDPVLIDELEDLINDDDALPGNDDLEDKPVEH